MSHPPETSRQLAERIWVCADDHSLADDYPERWKEKAAALIDAWVREREAAAHAAAIQATRLELLRLADAAAPESEARAVLKMASNVIAILAPADATSR